MSTLIRHAHWHTGTLDIGSHAALEAGTLQDSTSLLGPVPALRGGSRILDGRGH